MAETRRFTEKLASHIELLGITQMVLQDVTRFMFGKKPDPYSSGITCVAYDNEDGLIHDIEYNGVSIFEYVEQTRPMYGKSPLEEFIKKATNGG